MISVIGAGPAGCFYALKEKQDQIHIFEEDKKIGSPVSCTGILTSAVNSLMKIPKDVVVNRINKYKIISPDGKEVYIKLKDKDIILNRSKFDQHICQKALESGTKLHLGERFLGYKKIAKNEYMIKTSKKNYKTNMIVGADGPRSKVAQAAGIYGKREFIKGWQARCKCKGLESDTTTVYLNHGEFSWVVPEDNNIARVGVVGRDVNSMKVAYKKLIRNKKIIENQHGIIPLYNPKQKLRICDENVFLIGDAAGQVKATTYGGIIYGMIAGQSLAENRDKYVKNMKKSIGKELWLSLQARELMNKMNDDQANELIDIFQSKKNKRILSEVDRNFPSKLVLRLLLREPRLWKFGLKVLF